MYSINGTYIKTKNNIIEHMPNIKGMVAIDKDAIAKESDKRGTSQKGDNINYTEKTGGIAQTTDIDKEVNIKEESSSYSENVDIIDIEIETKVSEEIKIEKKTTFESSVSESRTGKNLKKTNSDVVTFCEHCNTDKCTLKLSFGDYPDLSNQKIDIYGPNGISSLIIPSEFSLIIYSKKNYEGMKWRINGPNIIGCLVHFGWNDTIASCKIFKTASLVKISIECGFKGLTKEIGPGGYPSMKEFGFQNNISAIRIGSDIKLIMYSGEKFTGESKEYDGPQTINCLISSGWSDRINSIIAKSKLDESPKKVDMLKDDWIKYFNSGPNKIIKRECQDCKGEYQTIYYKRLTPINKLTKNNGDLRDLFLNNWFSEGNKLNTDFELNSSYNDLINEPTPEKQTTMSITSVHYGENCGTEINSGTSLEDIKSKCNGKNNCDYLINHNIIGDPSRGCAKDYKVNFKCGDEQQDRYAFEKKEASGKNINLTCGKPNNKWNYCNYDDPTVGFPRDCGKTEAVPYEWNAINRVSAKSKYRFSIEVGPNVWQTVYQTPTFLVPFDDINIVSGQNKNELKDDASSIYGPDSIYVYANDTEFSFNGDYMNVPNENKYNLLGDYTIMCWVYKTRNTGWTRIIGKAWWGAANYGLWLGGSNDLYQEVAYSPGGYRRGQRGPRLSLGTWNHIAGSFKKGGEQKLYLNGKLIATSQIDAGGISLQNKEPFQIGGWSQRPSEGLYGLVKNIAVYNKQLSDEQINALALNHDLPVSGILSKSGEINSQDKGPPTVDIDLRALSMPGEVLWHYVKDKNKDENKFLWSGRIYNCMKGQIGCGSDFVDEGGSRHNAIRYLADDDSVPSHCITQTIDKYNYIKMGDDITNMDHVLIEVNATNDAHIALGEDTSHDGKHYEIILGGWNNNKSVIRAQNQGNSLVEHTEKLFNQDLVPGLTYKYYVVTNSNGSFANEPFKIETLNSPINYWWGNGKVLNSNKKDRVGLNISGFIKVPKSGNYKFRVRTDDGVRIKISDINIINSWRPQAPTYHESNNVELDLGSYKFEVDWYEWGGHAVLQLYWKTPGSNSWEVIPKEAFNLFAQKPQKFWISWKDNKLKVGKEHILNEKQLMETNISQYNYSIKNILVSTGWGSTGIWKLFSGSCNNKHLTKETADKLCNNPCYWYGKQGSGKVRKAFVDSNMCDCSKGSDPYGCHEKDGKCAKAINWDVQPIPGPKGMNSFTQSNTASITNTKEYKKTIEEEETYELKHTKYSEMSSETILLDPSISIFPGKSKKEYNSPTYFTIDELKNEEKAADEKLKLTGGPKNINNIIKTINNPNVEKPSKEITSKKTVQSESISLPPPPPPPPVKRIRLIENSDPIKEPEGSGISQKLIVLIIIIILLYILRK